MKKQISERMFDEMIAGVGLSDKGMQQLWEQFEKQLPDCHCGETCEWKWDEDKDSNISGCGIMYNLSFQHNFDYCPYCGRKIKEVKDENENEKDKQA